MSEKKDQEYFADGTAEEILDLLAKVPGLNVPARTSSFYFKGKSEDIPTIARRLMVANILEGSTANPATACVLPYSSFEQTLASISGQRPTIVTSMIFSKSRTRLLAKSSRRLKYL